jgi:hypothetical protein
VWGIRGAAAITLACFVVYFLGMAAVVKPALPGAVHRLVPPVPIVALATAPLAVAFEASAPTRVASVIVLAALVLGVRPRSGAAHSHGRRREGA